MIKKLDDEMGLLIKMHASFYIPKNYYRWGHVRGVTSSASVQTRRWSLIQNLRHEDYVRSCLVFQDSFFLLKKFVPQCTGTVRSPSGFEKEQFRSQIHLANQNGSDVWLLFDRLLRQSSHGLFYFYFCTLSPRALKGPVKGRRKSNLSNSVVLY